MAMLALAVMALTPSRADVALACAGSTPGALRCLVTFGVVYACALLSLVAETLLRQPCGRACAMRVAQGALVSLFGQVVAHRGDLLCAEAARQHVAAAPARRAVLFAVYARAARAGTERRGASSRCLFFVWSVERYS